MTGPLEADDRRLIEDGIRQIEGVEQALVDARSGEIWVVRGAEHERSPVEAAVRDCLEELGHDPDALELRLSRAESSGTRRRIRFLEAERAEEYPGVTITIRLQWKDDIHTGSATGYSGTSHELTAAAQATLQAVEAVIGTSLDLRIMGVKRIQAFDSKLIVASLLRLDNSHDKLVGAVIATDDPLAAAALAVLSALNRPLGNFIHTTD